MSEDFSVENPTAVTIAGNKQQINERDVWSKSAAALKAKMDPQLFKAYIEPLCLRSFDDAQQEVLIDVPSRFLRSHIEKNYSEKITEELTKASGKNKLRVRFMCDRAVNSAASDTTLIPGTDYVVVKRTPAAPAPKPKTPDLSGFSFGSLPNPKYTFSSFVVGNSNQFCHAAAMRVADEPGASYNPLFIYGGVGLGKTHLLHAIGNSVLQKDPDASVVYLSSETFTNELISALRYGKMEEFKNRLRSVNVLLIDDIQFMGGKERTQEEFFHTFNALYELKRQIVMTCDTFCSDIPGIEERLKTRFSWGLTADIQAPDFETRVAILKRKAASDSFDVPEDVCHYIADNISSNVRELEGALTRVHAMGSLQSVPVDLAMAQNALKSIITPRNVKLTIASIKGAVAQYFSLKPADLASKNRSKNISFPRQIAMYLCRKHTTSSYPEIGLSFGGRDHSSVIHSANVVSAKLSQDESLRDLILVLEQQVGAK